MIHPNPLWYERGNFVIRAYLGFEDSRHEWEQLYTTQISEYRFKLCCIPFLAYDLALDDEVETDTDFTIQKVVSHSGHWTFRVVFPEDVSENTVKEILTMCDDYGVFHEHNHTNLLAISAPDPLTGQKVADYLWDLEQKGKLEYDTGRTHD
jgi:hypothetical protein